MIRRDDGRFDGLLAVSQDSGDDVRATASVEYCEKSQRRPVRRVCYRLLAHQGEAQGERQEIGPAVTLMGKFHQDADSLEDFRYNAVGRVRVVLSNVAAKFVEIVECFRVENVATRAGRHCRCACVFSIRRR